MDVRAAFSRMSRSMWSDERSHPLLYALLYLAGFFGTLLVSQCNAHAATVGLHLATQHLEHTEARLNTATPGLFVRTDAGFTAGLFRNSQGRGSTYAGWTWQTDDRRFALTAGVITGYSAARAMPLVTPSVRFDLGAGISARLAYVPKPLKHGHSSGLHFGIETEF